MSLLASGFLGLLILGLGLAPYVYIVWRLVAFGREVSGRGGVAFQILGGTYFFLSWGDAFARFLDPIWPASLPRVVLVGYLFALAFVNIVTGIHFFQWGLERWGQRNSLLERLLGVGLMSWGGRFGLFGLWVLFTGEVELSLPEQGASFFGWEGGVAALIGVLGAIGLIFPLSGLVLFFRELRDWWSESRPWG